MKSDFTVGIIGGNGRMGRALRKFFKNNNIETVFSDKGSDISNVGLSKISNIIIISVPLTQYEPLLKEISPYLNNDKMIMDIGSLKYREMKIMQNYFKGEILATHPLFGPEKNFYGNENNIVVCKINPDKKTEFILNLFKKNKLNIIEMTPEEHDRVMAYIHSFYYLMNLTYIEILKDEFNSFKNIKGLMTTSFSKYIENIKNNVFNTQDSLIELIAYKNPFIEEVVNKYKAKIFKKFKIDDLKGFLDNEQLER